MKLFAAALYVFGRESDEALEYCPYQNRLPSSVVSWEVLFRLEFIEYWDTIYDLFSFISFKFLSRVRFFAVDRNAILVPLSFFLLQDNSMPLMNGLRLAGLIAEYSNLTWLNLLFLLPPCL